MSNNKLVFRFIVRPFLALLFGPPHQEGGLDKTRDGVRERERKQLATWAYGPSTCSITFGDECMRQRNMALARYVYTYVALVRIFWQQQRQRRIDVAFRISFPFCCIKLL